MKRLICLILLLALLGSAAQAEPLPDEQLMTYYSGALFIGDSVIRMLGNYIRPLQKKDPLFFPGVKFFAEYDYRLSTAAAEKLSGNKEIINLVYKGRNCTMYSLVETLQPPKIVLLLGCNDSLNKRMEAGVENVRIILETVPKYCEETQVIFLSLPPVTTAYEKRKAYRSVWESFDEQVAALCAEYGAVFIDVTAGLVDEDGFLVKGLSSDGEYHLNEKGNEIVVRNLLDYVQGLADAGLWAPTPAEENE
jgi:hypothetical protein